MFNRTLFRKRLQTVVNNYEKRKKQRLNAVFYPRARKLVFNGPPAVSTLTNKVTHPAPHQQVFTSASTNASRRELSPTQQRISVTSQLSCGSLIELSPTQQRLSVASQLSCGSFNELSPTHPRTTVGSQISFGQLSFASILESDEDFEDIESQSQRKPSKRKRHKKPKKRKMMKPKRKHSLPKKPTSGVLHNTPVSSAPELTSRQESRATTRRRLIVRINEINATISDTARKLSRLMSSTQCFLLYM